MKAGRKFIKYGAENCSDTELLSILIGVGVTGKTAEEISAEIMQKYGSFGEMMGKPLDELATIKGIGPVKAIRIATAFELARRIIKELENNS